MNVVKSKTYAYAEISKHKLRRKLWRFSRRVSLGMMSTPGFGVLLGFIGSSFSTGHWKTAYFGALAWGGLLSVLLELT